MNPTNDRAAVVDSSRELHLQPVLTSPTTGTLRVVLVEDSSPVRERIGGLMEEIGSIEIVGTANSAVDAIVQCKEHRPDALILDLYLKDGNAFGVITDVKRLLPDCVVIVLTNFATLETRQHCLGLGAEHFFEKTQEFERVPEVLAALYQARHPGA